MNHKQMLDLLSTMPALRHSVEGEVFDIENSAVVQWVLSQRGVKEWLFNRIAGSGRIVYNEVSKCWAGKVVNGDIREIGWESKRKKSDDKYLEALKSLHWGANSTGIASIMEAVQCSRATTYRRLNQLIKTGKVAKDGVRYVLRL